MDGAEIPIGSDAHSYPALIARIGEDRRLTFAEFRRLVIRIQGEISPVGAINPCRRRQLRTVLSALGLI